jgi:hypothetical protein
VTRSNETVGKIRAGATALERLIRQAPFSKNTGTYQYDGRVSVKEVLRLAGVKSAATLHHTHHGATKKWLDGRIKELKALAGRGRVQRDPELHGEKVRDREKRMAEELAAANYKILELQRALTLAENGRRKGSNVVSFKRKH